ncbi:MAG: YfhO family protein [Parabacteroides sp.]|nr:YfhO family protein [Parabacteroides sp.]
MYKKIGQQALVIVFFVALTVLYFAPGILGGKVLLQGDTTRFTGMSHELLEHYQKEGKGSAWTGSMFSGMPAYHIAMYGTPPNYLEYAERVVKQIDYQTAGMVLVGLICFYILMCVMGVNRWLAITGAVAFAFTSYNIIIIVAGHVTKAYVIAYMPLTLAGMCLLFRQKWLWGAVLFTLGVALSITNNHLQITYYLFLFCLVFYVGYLVQMLKEKAYPRLLKVTGALAACALLAVLPNISNLYFNYEQAKESMRGPSELTAAVTGDTAKPSDGLEQNYAFEWSYGKGELLTLLVPDAYGGESGGTVDSSSELYKALRAKGAQVGNEIQTYTYWGDQLFTAGPVYFGAVICFLFVLGMFVIRNPLKWWIFGASVFFVFLALGRNLMWFNDWMFHYLPMYNKFRTPSMALVIPEMTFPLIGIWGLSLVLRQKVDSRLLKRGFWWAFGITGGICLVLWLMPTVFLDFQSALDARYQLPDWYYNALLNDRRALASSDAFRSLVFVVLTAALLFWFGKAGDKKKMAMWVSIGMLVLVLADLWTVDRRYLGEKNYVLPRTVEPYKASVADKEILKDTDPSYRVLNLNDPFQDATTPYFHKSVGGYHPAKLRRYQELIDFRLIPEIRALGESKTVEELRQALRNSPSLNMLNTRYIIYSPEQAPVVNPYAYGNAWFVNGYELVDNADAEIKALDTLQPLQRAVIDKRFAAEVEGKAVVPDSTAQIVLVSYKPDELVYRTVASGEQLAVFSEIYYPHGWKAYIDGVPAPHFRADWTLRAMWIPAGEHTVEFKFIPDTYNTIATVASVSSGVILLLLIVALGYSLWATVRKKNQDIIL